MFRYRYLIGSEMYLNPPESRRSQNLTFRRYVVKFYRNVVADPRAD
jgi:hypothetical protein